MTLCARWIRKTTTGMAALVTALLLSTSRAPAENWLQELEPDREDFGTTTNVSVLLGQRLLDSGDWAPVDSQSQVGIDVTRTPEGWPAGWCGSLLLSGAKGTSAGAEVTARMAELQLGGRKTWALGRWLRPYAGGGASLLGLWYEVDGGPMNGSDTVAGLGLWLGGGASLRLGDAWRLGVDTRYSQTSVKIGGERRNAGGLQVGLIAGYQWSDR